MAEARQPILTASQLQVGGLLDATARLLPRHPLRDPTLCTVPGQVTHQEVGDRLQRGRRSSAGAEARQPRPLHAGGNPAGSLFNFMATTPLKPHRTAEDRRKSRFSAPVLLMLVCIVPQWIVGCQLLAPWHSAGAAANNNVIVGAAFVLVGPGSVRSRDSGRVAVQSARIACMCFRWKAGCGDKVHSGVAGPVAGMLCTICRPHRFLRLSASRHVLPFRALETMRYHPSFLKARRIETGSGNLSEQTAKSGNPQVPSCVVARACLPRLPCQAGDYAACVMKCRPGGVRNGDC